MREEKKMSDFDSSTFAAMKAAGAEVPVFIPGETNKRVPVADFASNYELPKIAVYGETTYSEVTAMLDGGTQNDQPRSKCIPIVCVMPYDTEIPYYDRTYDTITKGTTLMYTGQDDDGFHFAHVISHSTGPGQPPVTMYSEATLNSQNVWSLKLRNSLHIAGLNVNNDAAVIRLTPGMSTTATLNIDGGSNGEATKSYMLLPTSVTSSPRHIANMQFIGFDTMSGMTPCMISLLAFAGMTVAGVSYPYQTVQTQRLFVPNTAGDAGLASLQFAVSKDNNDLNGYTLRVGTEYLAIAAPYDRTKSYTEGEFCITSNGLWRLEIPYTPPADFTSANWKKVTLIELLAEKLSGVTHDSTLTGDGTANSPLSVVGGGGSGGLDVVSHDNSLSGDGTVASPLSVVSSSERVQVTNIDNRIEVQGQAVGKLTPHISLAYTKNGLSKISGYVEVTTAFRPVYSVNDKGGSQYWPSLFVIDITDYDDFPTWSGNSVLIDRINNVYVPIQFSKATVSGRTYLSVNGSSEITVQIYNKEFLPYWM